MSMSEVDATFLFEHNGIGTSEGLAGCFKHMEGVGSYTLQLICFNSFLTLLVPVKLSHVEHAPVLLFSQHVLLAITRSICIPFCAAANYCHGSKRPG